MAGFAKVALTSEYQRCVAEAKSLADLKACLLKHPKQRSVVLPFILARGGHPHPPKKEPPPPPPPPPPDGDPPPPPPAEGPP